MEDAEATEPVRRGSCAKAHPPRSGLPERSLLKGGTLSRPSRRYARQATHEAGWGQDWRRLHAIGTIHTKR
jgi:hypothetical protein